MGYQRRVHGVKVCDGSGNCWPLEVSTLVSILFFVNSRKTIGNVTFIKGVDQALVTKTVNSLLPNTDHPMLCITKARVENSWTDHDFTESVDPKQLLTNELYEG